MPQEWAPPASFYQSPQPPVQPNTQGQWAAPTPNYYPSPSAVPPPQQGQWSMPANYQMPPANQQQWGSPPMHDDPAPLPGSSQFAPAPVSAFTGPAQLEYTIPPKYNGDVLDKHGSKIYHLSTAASSPTVLSDPTGTTIGRIDWGHHNESHASVTIRHNKWHRDQLLHPNKDKTFTFRVNQQAGGYTWKGFQNGIQCFDPSGSKIAEFSYRTTNVVTLDPAHSELVELVIVTALLIHHQQSRHGGHEGAFGKTGEGATEGMTEAIAEAVIKGLVGGV